MKESSFQEKRQFGRIKIQGNTLCEIHIPERQNVKVYYGLIKNISLGGMYFICNEKPLLEKDDVRNFNFVFIDNAKKIYQLDIHAVVVRTEIAADQFAVALKFLSDPVYCPIAAREQSEGETAFVDKIRTLYENYQLYKKGYDLIKQASNTRSERVNKIKKLLDQNLYHLDSVKLAASLTKNQIVKP